MKEMHWRYVSNKYGRLDVVRKESAKNTFTDRFTITLTDLDGGVHVTGVNCFHDAQFDRFRMKHEAVGPSTYGLELIDFPESMQKKGIGYIFHGLMAHSAFELCCKHVAIIGALEGKDERILCSSPDIFGMKYKRGVDGDFHLRPHLLNYRAMGGALRKGWRRIHVPGF